MRSRSCLRCAPWSEVVPLPARTGGCWNERSERGALDRWHAAAGRPDSHKRARLARGLCPTLAMHAPVHPLPTPQPATSRTTTAPSQKSTHALFRLRPTAETRSTPLLPQTPSARSPSHRPRSAPRPAMCKHILNAQVAIRSPCCQKWFDVSSLCPMPWDSSRAPAGRVVRLAGPVAHPLHSLPPRRLVRRVPRRGV